MTRSLRLVNGGNPPITRVVCVASGKGGVGKTHTTLNLALALESLGKRVLVLDADFGLANLNIMLGVMPEYSIEDFFYGSMPLDEIVFKISDGFHFLAGGSGIWELTTLSSEQRLDIHSQLEALAGLYDYLLIDSPAGISSQALFFSAAANEVLLVVNPEPTSLTDAYAVIKVLTERYRERQVLVVVNCANSQLKLGAENVYQKLRQAAADYLNVNVHYMGAIPSDPLVGECILDRTPLYRRYPNSVSGRAIRRLASKLNNESPYMKAKGGLQFFFEKFVELEASK
jgi:flagellar biosynthesis protein FlhG